MQALRFGDLRFVGTVIFDTTTIPAEGSGDIRYSTGLALRTVDGERRATLALSRAMAVEFNLPDALVGKAKYLRTLGRPQREAGVEALERAGTLSAEAYATQTAPIWGLSWDRDEEDALWATSHIEYDTAGANARTISRARIPDTGMLVTDGFWRTTLHPDKQTSGGVVAVPPPFRSYVDGKRLAAGFGGYQSVAATGPISAGPALTAFDWPEAGTDQILDRPLQGFRFGTNPDTSPRQQRPIDYRNDFKDGFPSQPTAETGGFFTWADRIDGAGAWIYTAQRWGFLTIGTLGYGRVWYGNNTDGVPASINSEGTNHCWFLTDPADLMRVATGQARENTIQAAFEPVQFPGVKYPMPGTPNGQMSRAYGAAWDGEVLGILLSRAGPLLGTLRTPVIHFYELAPPALPPSAPATVEVY
jgi:hypothetical protein